MSDPVDRDAEKAVTPDMIEAGVSALFAWKNLPTGELVAAIYRAMATQTPTERARAKEQQPR